MGTYDLIIAEGAIVFRILHMIGLAVRATFVLKIWWFLSGACIVLCIGAMLWKLRNSKAACAWSIIILDAGLVALLQLGYFSFHYRLDFNFLALAVLAATCVAHLSSPHRIVRIASWLALLVALVHIPYARNNAVVLLPVYLLAAVIWGTPIRSWWKRLAAAAAGTLCIWGGIMLMMPVITSPHVCMEISDMKIAAILNNEFDAMKGKLASTGYEISSDSDPLGERPLLCPEAYIEPSGSMRGNLPELYREEWGRVPKEMLMARIIQTVRFYCDGYVPQWVRSMVAWKYPHLGPDNPAWEGGNDAGDGSPLAVYFKPALYGAALVVLAWYLFRVKRLTPVGKAAVFIASISFTYLLSFLVAVPTADHRYHTPVLFGIFCFLALALADRQGNKTPARETGGK